MIANNRRHRFSGVFRLVRRSSDVGIARSRVLAPALATIGVYDAGSDDEQSHRATDGEEKTNTVTHLVLSLLFVFLLLQFR